MINLLKEKVGSCENLDLAHLLVMTTVVLKQYVVCVAERGLMNKYVCFLSTRCSHAV